MLWHLCWPEAREDSHWGCRPAAGVASGEVASTSLLPSRSPGTRASTRRRGPPTPSRSTATASMKPTTATASMKPMLAALRARVTRALARTATRAKTSAEPQPATWGKKASALLAEMPAPANGRGSWSPSTKMTATRVPTACVSSSNGGNGCWSDFPWPAAWGTKALARLKMPAPPTEVTGPGLWRGCLPRVASGRAGRGDCGGAQGGGDDPRPAWAVSGRDGQTTATIASCGYDLWRGCLPRVASGRAGRGG